jgi:hypothetical protein
MIRFACPACSKGLKAQDSAAGVKIACPACGHPFHIPERAPPAPAPSIRRSPAQGTTCPGCGRFISLGPEEWSLTIECAQCDTRFRPDGALTPPPPRVPVSVPPPPMPAAAAYTPAPGPSSGPPTLRPHRGTLVLMLGIVSVVLLPFLGPLAWRLGHKDLQAMHDGEMDPNGMDLTNYGKRMGMFATISMFICVILFLFLPQYLLSLLSSHQPSMPQLPNLDNLGKFN